MAANTTTSSSLLAIAAIALLGCGGAEKAQKPTAEIAAPQPATYPRCDSLEEKGQEVWSPKIRGELDFSVRIYNGEILAADAELAVNRLDEFTKAWIKTSADACRKHTDAGTLEGEEYGTLSACLDRALESQRVVIESMKTGGKAAIAQAQTLPESVKGCTGEAIDASATTDMRDNPFGGKP
jgi:hypothetical protein